MAQQSTIYLEGLSFDAAHFIPSHPVCGRAHGHTYQVKVVVTGEPDPVGMVIDFGVLKTRVKAVLGQYDHRMFVNRKYVKTDGNLFVDIQYERHNGPHVLTLPNDEVQILDGESTIELITRVITADLARDLSSMKYKITRLQVECTEGLHKGAIVECTGVNSEGLPILTGVARG